MGALAGQKMVEESGAMPIAIVGMGCRFPGGASSPEKLWDMLLRKESARKETPPDRFNIDAFYHPNADKNGTINNRAGHYLEEDISAFDAPFFSISPAEAVSMDPMQRMLLEVVYEATENAGIALSTLAGTNTSCYVGCFTSDYDQIAKRDPELLPKYHSVGTGQAILSNRVSYCFDLKGPSVTLDTACSSSLVAIHLACQSLRTGESEAAIVGATHAILNPDVMVGMTNLHFLSPDSKCHTFDHRANGYARGEGMAAVILKSLDAAIRDGDTVRAVIRGTAVNSNGKNPGITLPSREAQARLIRSAYEQGGCDPAVTGYCEAHGTGTAAGDPIEAGALGDALGVHRADGEESKLFVGSVKTNIGHLEGASGLAGLIKAVMSVESGIIAPNLWFEKGNPDIDFDAWRIRVPTEPVPWPKPGLRRASVNGFGYGGTNGHVIVDDAYHYMRPRNLNGKHKTVLRSEDVCESADLESGASGAQTPSTSEAAATDSSSASSSSSIHSITTDQPPRPRAFYLSAHESSSLTSLAKTYVDYLATAKPSNEEKFLDDLAFTLSERRSKLEFGSTIIASTFKELIDGLNDLPLPTRKLPRVPRIGFVFTGQGAQWWAMGRELMQYPVFAQSIDACSRAIASFGSSWSLSTEFLKDQKTSRINEAEISQPLCSAVQIGLVDLYASWGISPSRVVGHSSGEIAAAYATGALSLEAAMCVAYHRGVLSSKIKTLGFKGGMMAVGASEEEALREIRAMGDASDQIVVACVNSPRSVTLSGDMPALMNMQKILTSRQIFARRLQVGTAYHSHHMMALADEYRQRLENLKVAYWEERKNVTMFSSVFSEEISEDHNLGADYWVDNMVSCVQFSGALAQLCTNEPGDAPRAVDVLLELGPHAALAGPVKQILASLEEPDVPSTIRYLSALTRGKDAAVMALTAASSLFSQGYPANILTANFPDSTPISSLSVLVDLPTYRWNRTRKYWAESRISKDYRFRHGPRTDILGAPFHDWNPIEPRWRNFIRLSEQPWVRSHVVQGAIVYPAAGFCCMALEAAAQMSALLRKTRKAQESREAVAEYKIKNLSISRALVVPETKDGVEVIFSMRPEPISSTASSDTWNEFRTFSYTTEQGWQEHCRGAVSVHYNTGEEQQHKVQECSTAMDKIRDGCALSMSPEGCYDGLNSVGLYYGPEFQGITGISSGGYDTHATITVTDTAAGMPKRFEHKRMIHPATMDSFLQMSILGIARGDARNLKQAYVPTFIEQLSITGGLVASAGQKLKASARSTTCGKREISANVVAIESSSKGVIMMQGVKLVALASEILEGLTDRPTKHCATVVWEPEVDLLSTDQLNRDLQAHRGDSIIKRSMADREFLSFYFMNQALKEIREEEVSVMHQHHQKFYRYMKHQRALAESHQQEHQTDDWLRLDDPDVRDKIDCLIKTLPEITSPYEAEMFLTMGRNLKRVMRKEVEPLSLMMKDGLLHKYYEVSLGTSSTYSQVARYISLLSHKNPDLEYLEIGAGTGGCTKPVLEALGGNHVRNYPRMKSYTFTDISTGFFEKAAEKFAEYADLIEFARLDIEQDPTTQSGFKNDRQFDVVIAANVLHASYDIERTMKHVRKLLRPGGKLVLLDMTHTRLSNSHIWGNVSGWWNCRESWREFGPLLSEDQWQRVLHSQGFSDFDANTPDTSDPLEEETRVIVATAVEHQIEVKAQLNGHTGPPVLIIIPNNSLDGVDMVAAVRSQLGKVSANVNSCTLKESVKHDLSGTIVISLAELTHSLLTIISREEFGNLQRLLSQSYGCLWVTRGSTATKGTVPELSIFQGMARSLRAENENRPLITLDLNAETPLSHSEAADMIVKLFKQVFEPDNNANVNASRRVVIDREFSESNGKLHIMRAVENSSLDELIAAETKGVSPLPEMRELDAEGRALQLRIETIGTGNGNGRSLAFDDPAWAGKTLPEDAVEVSVRAVGLSRRDALVYSGGLEEDEAHIGSECAGVVTQVGDRVGHLKPGDRVVVWQSGSTATVVRAHVSRVQKIPDTLPFSTAATLPISVTTAYYTLVKAARIQDGDSVLITRAACGVGRAAIRIAQLYGVQSFATVDSEEEKVDLVQAHGLHEDQILLTSHADVAATILQRTNGRGIDIVLNCSAGDDVKTERDTIASFGRFIEVLGNGSNASSDALKASPVARNVLYAAIDMSTVFQAKIFAEAMDLVREGKIREDVPSVIEPFSQIQTVVSSWQERKSLDRVVVEPRAGNKVLVVPARLKHMEFRGDATYLLAGGLGGLGRSISRWMVSKGARNLVYVSRSGASSTEARALLEELRSAGANTKVIKCDITNGKALSTAVADVLETMPAIRGVIQGAMNLKDQIFTNMSYEAFTTCLRPKVQGSWSLHTATLDQPLDFFVLLSSCASFWGNAGQSNYAAGCAYQVALAAHRRSLGLPGSAIDVGKIASVGFVADKTGTVSEQNLVKLGLIDVSEEELLTMVELAMLPVANVRDSDIPNGHLLTGLHSTKDANKGEELPFWSRDPVFSHMDFVRPHLQKKNENGEAGQVSGQEHKPLPVLLGSAQSAREAEGFILQALVQKLGRALMMPVDDIDASKPTSAYGVDSLIAVELRNWLSREAKVDMPVFDILQAPSLGGLAAKLITRTPLVKVEP